MKITAISLALLTGLLTGCDQQSPPPVSSDLHKGIVSYSTGFYGSEILRVPVSQDGVVCYVAVETRVLKSINCIKVDGNAGK